MIDISQPAIIRLKVKNNLINIFYDNLIIELLFLLYHEVAGVAINNLNKIDASIEKF